MICFLGYDYQILNAQGSAYSPIRIILILITLILTATLFICFRSYPHFNCPTKTAIQTRPCTKHRPPAFHLLLFLYYGIILYLLLRFPQLLGPATLIGMFCGFSLSALITSTLF